jgi:Taurine catabolism dioxygenase TauD, TfdA family
MNASQDRAAWTGAALDYRADGLHTFSAAEIEEIDAALAHLRDQGELDFPAITPDTFPLPTLDAFFRGLRDELRFGRGFVLLRGIPRARYSSDDMARIYFGLGAHIGSPLPQSWQGELLGHVIDVSDIEPGARGYHAGGAQRFHTDSCDVVSLMCLQAAKSGGASRICSSIAVHRRLERERPDLLQVLYDDFTFRRREVDAEHGSGVLVRRISVFARTGDEISVFLSGDYPNRAVAAGDAVMTAIQREALDEVQRIAAAPDTYLDMNIGEGDIQFLNNRMLLHGRTGYEDHGAMARRRHLLRLWLKVPGWPPQPEGQAMHTGEDHPLWLRQRVPFMEVPSRYLAEITARQAELAH